MKVTVVGAGAVGASCAEYIAMKNFCAEVVLVDIKEGFAEGKAMDLMQTASLNGFDTKITGTTGDYSKTAGSDVAVITSGIPRKPGMTREELIGINAGIVKEVQAFIAPKIFGGMNSKTPVEGIGVDIPSEAVKLKYTDICQIGEDIKITCQVCEKEQEESCLQES